MTQGPSPVDLFLRTLRRSERLMEAHGILHGQRQGRPTQLAADILRAAVVLLVAALDDFVHTAVPAHLESVLTGTSGSPEALVQRYKAMFAKSPEEALELLRADDPLAQFIDQLSAQLRGDTLTGPGQIQYAMSLVGVAAWPAVAEAMGGADEEVRQRLDRVNRRRNEIVHESDLRPGGGKTRDISRAFVKDSIGFVRDLGLAIDEVLTRELGPIRPTTREAESDSKARGAATPMHPRLFQP